MSEITTRTILDYSDGRHCVRRHARGSMTLPAAFLDAVEAAAALDIAIGRILSRYDSARYNIHGRPERITNALREAEYRIGNSTTGSDASGRDLCEILAAMNTPDGCGNPDTLAGLADWAAELHDRATARLEAIEVTVYREEVSGE